MARNGLRERRGAPVPGRPVVPSVDRRSRSEVFSRALASSDGGSRRLVCGGAAGDPAFDSHLRIACTPPLCVADGGHGTPGAAGGPPGAASISFRGRDVPGWSEWPLRRDGCAADARPVESLAGRRAPAALGHAPRRRRGTRAARARDCHAGGCDQRGVASRRLRRGAPLAGHATRLRARASDSSAPLPGPARTPDRARGHSRVAGVEAPRPGCPDRGPPARGRSVGRRRVCVVVQRRGDGLRASGATGPGRRGRARGP